MKERQENTPYYSNPLSLLDVRARVDIARVAAYGSFIEEKDGNDFYFETLLNYFLSLAQYPLNFAVFDSTKSLLFHLCLDKQHRNRFSDDLSQICENRTYLSSILFPLFPGILENQYFIAIFHMKTKNKKKPWAPFQFPGVPVIDEKLLAEIPVKDFEDYVSQCGARFFSEDWYTFQAPFADIAAREIKTSIGKLTEGFKKSPDFLSFPHRTDVSWPNWTNGPDAWREKINDTLGRYINDAHHGFRSITAMSQPDREMDQFSTPLPPNFLLAYRSFSRGFRGKNGNLRHWDAQRGGYSYDVQFVVPKIEERMSDVANGNMVDYRGFLSSLSSPEVYERRDARFFLYRNILNNLKKKEIEQRGQRVVGVAKNLVGLMDEEFWKLITMGEPGVRKILECLAAPIGDYARSMVDPVFHTGLIHYNQIFQFGGLDRIDHLKLADVASFSEIDEGIQSDLIRIVSVYYILSAAAAGFQTNPSLNTEATQRSLSVALLPIKIRGSVWGVGVHAFYLEDEESRSFLYHTKWLANFLFTTTGRIKSQNRIDRLLWEQSLNRVTTLLREHIGAVAEAGSDSHARAQRFFQQIAVVNHLLHGEQMATPFALPRFSLHDDSGSSTTRGNEVRQWVGKTGEDDEFLRIRWTIVENEFFVPLQPWSQRATRSFREAVRLGTTAGFELMRARLPE